MHTLPEAVSLLLVFVTLLTHINLLHFNVCILIFSHYIIYNNLQNSLPKYLLFYCQYYDNYVTMCLTFSQHFPLKQCDVWLLMNCWPHTCFFLHANNAYHVHNVSYAFIVLWIPLRLFIWLAFNTVCIFI